MGEILQISCEITEGLSPQRCATLYGTATIAQRLPACSFEAD